MKIPAPPLWLLGLLALFQLTTVVAPFSPAAPPEQVRFEELLMSSPPSQVANTRRLFAFADDRGPALTVAAQAQSNPVSCGQSSVAMAVNYLTGKNLRDVDIDQTYGFELLRALREECQPAGYSWRDAGDLVAGSWPLIETKLLVERTPVILALNGEAFSPNCRGQIVLVTGISGESVIYVDPADGLWHTTTRSQIESCVPHPDGKFIFVAEAL